jgi:CspA family cold shock protein
MPFVIQLVLAIIIAIATATVYNLQLGQAIFQPASAIAFSIATILTLLISRLGATSASSSTSSKPAKRAAAKGSDEGIVKWFNASKGFGFITRDNGEDLFVHQRSLADSNRRSLRQGQRVSFKIVDSEKGPQAADVDVLGGGESEGEGDGRNRRNSHNRNR